MRTVFLIFIFICLNGVHHYVLLQRAPALMGVSPSGCLHVFSVRINSLSIVPDADGVCAATALVTSGSAAVVDKWSVAAVQCWSTLLTLNRRSVTVSVVGVSSIAESGPPDTQ